MIVSVIWDQQPGELHLTQGEAIKQLGYEHEFLRIDQNLPPNTQVVFVQGPYGPLLSLIQNLSEIPAAQRPKLIYWFQQSLQFVRPACVNNSLAKIFSDLHRHNQKAGLLGQVAEIMAPNFMTNKGSRLGFLGDLVYLHHNGLLDLLVLSSTVYAEHLKQLNIPSLIVPRGYHESYGRVLNYERDIGAVWMGKIRTKRRSRAIRWLKHELEKRQISMHVYDGEKAGFIFGQERTEILNRAHFVLNLNFSGPTDELSIRFFVAGANGAVVLTEPNDNRYPFVPGEHLLESSIEDMPDIMLHYVNHPSEWQTISTSMLKYLKEKCTLESSISKILSSTECT